jgi:hypothetical protein
MQSASVKVLSSKITASFNFIKFLPPNDAPLIDLIFTVVVVVPVVFEYFVPLINQLIVEPTLRTANL